MHTLYTNGGLWTCGMGHGVRNSKGEAHTLPATYPRGVKLSREHTNVVGAAPGVLGRLEAPRPLPGAERGERTRLRDIC